MNVIPIAERETYSVPVAASTSITYELCPYVDLGDAGDVTFEVLLHELESSNLLIADLLVYAAACSPEDPQTIFRGPLLKKVDLLTIGVGGVGVAGLGGSWGTGIAVDLLLIVLVPQ